MALSQFNVPRQEFVVDAVLFDMDGTLTDSIKAVEAAWGSVAESLDRDKDEVIAATHGRRAIDNLRDLKPHLRRLSNKEMEPHVDDFERSILRQADEYGEKVEEARSRRGSSAANSRRGSMSLSRPGSKPASAPGSRRGSTVNSRKGSFAKDILKPNPFGFSQLSMTATSTASPATISPSEGANSLLVGSSPGLSTPGTDYEDVFDDDDDLVEVDCEDKSVVILPGVKRMIDAIPEGRYAVATSGAKVYCHGCLTRVDITPPKVTITADHEQLERGKPHPDPFLLAAKHLGYDPTKCLVVEDSPSGIKAGVASGATVLAVCTSHPREKIAHCGATHIVPSLDHVRVHIEADGRLRIILDEAAAFPDDKYAQPANAEVLARKLAGAELLGEKAPIPEETETSHAHAVQAAVA